MKKMRILAMCIMIIICFEGSVYANEGYDGSNEPYMECITITFDNDETKSLTSYNAQTMEDIKTLSYFKQAMDQIEEQGFDLAATTVKSALSDLIPDDGDLIAISIKNVYCEEGFVDGERYSKLMTKGEVEAAKRELSVEPMGLIDNSTKTRGKLTFIASVSTTTVAGRELAYYVGTTAEWATMGSNGELYPASGKDAICVSWGGDFYRNDSKMLIKSFNGNSIPYEPVGYTPNEGYGWAFEDAMTTSGTASCMNRAVGGVTLTRIHALDELTEIFATYVHTYKKLTWSFSVGFSGGDSLTGGVSVTPSTATEYWSIVANVPNIAY